jgi:hypothetical protein
LEEKEMAKEKGWVLIFTTNDKEGQDLLEIVKDYGWRGLLATTLEMAMSTAKEKAEDIRFAVVDIEIARSQENPIPGIKEIIPGLKVMLMGSYDSELGDFPTLGGDGSIIKPVMSEDFVLAAHNMLAGRRI